MQLTKIKKVSGLTLAIIIIGCSTKKDTFLARNSHALSTEYNILYNGNIALEKGLINLRAETKDNFWEQIPIEQMQIVEEQLPGSKPKNKDFETAEAKATKAIQKHSMNIKGLERNPQMDEAYLLLGKARYYDQRFLPALDAFNYILYKYPGSDKINEAKIWREKANMRLENDAIVIKNLNKLLTNKKLSKENLNQAHALMAASYIHLGKKDSAIVNLQKAAIFAHDTYEKARYKFVVGQLHQELGRRDSAIAHYNQVIAMNRKAERKFVMQSHAKKAQLFDYKNDDALLFEKTYEKLLVDRENRPFLDVLFHNYGLYFQNGNKYDIAKKMYNFSLRRKSTDTYLDASNYRNLAQMYFNENRFELSAKYYDSTLVKLDDKTREYHFVQKRRKVLDDVINYESIVHKNDSILKLVAMSPTDRTQFFEKHIEGLKKKAEQQRIEQAKKDKIAQNIARNTQAASDDIAMNPSAAPQRPNTKIPSFPTDGGEGQAFYFYNSNLTAYGKIEFKKIWGNRNPDEYWRIASLSNQQGKVADTLQTQEQIKGNKKVEEIAKEPENYKVAFYLKQIPTKETELDNLLKERNFASYQLGVIYKEKLKENLLSSNRFEDLLKHNPEEKWKLPTYYNLYKIFQETNDARVSIYKQKILTEYPSSRYAQLINSNQPQALSLNNADEKVYNECYQWFKDEKFELLAQKLETLIPQYYGEEIVSKFELLKANMLGKTQGLQAYKKGLQYVVENYYNTEEGRNAAEILKTQIPMLEQSKFEAAEGNDWVVVFKISNREDALSIDLEKKWKQFFKDQNLIYVKYTCDNYNNDNTLFVIHGIKNRQYAEDIVYKFAEEKKYKVDTKGYAMTKDNYKVVQLLKNLDDYKLTPKP